MNDPVPDAAILAFIGNYIADYGYPPTQREVGNALGLSSPSSVNTRLRNLVRKGKLRRDARGKPGYWPVVDEGWCPCCGSAIVTKV